VGWGSGTGQAGGSSAGFPSINRFGLLILFACEGAGRRILVGDRAGDSRRYRPGGSSGTCSTGRVVGVVRAAQGHHGIEKLPRTTKNNNIRAVIKTIVLTDTPTSILPHGHPEWRLSQRRLLDATAVGPRNFEKRYGLASKPSQIRCRILDRRFSIHGLTDLAVPTGEFAALDLPVERVFVTENEINGLAFPNVPASLVIFGLGYGLERLGEVGWLRQRALHYWGDIDTYGFHILDRLRSIFPDAQSFLMDRETLQEHVPLWVRESSPYDGELRRLTCAEWALYENLRHNRLGDRVRLEQERIPFGRIERALDGIAAR
jgi:hypothetical protein